MTVLSILAYHGEEHRIGPLVVAGPVLQLDTIDIKGRSIVQGTDEASSAEVAAAGFEAGDG